jgi:hypothetical protein
MFVSPYVLHLRLAGSFLFGSARQAGTEHTPSALLQRGSIENEAVRVKPN